MITLEHIFQQILGLTELHNDRSTQTLATMTDIKTAAAAIQQKQTDFQTQLTGIKTAVDTAVADLISNQDAKNQEVLDSIKAVLDAIGTQIDAMVASATDLQTELTNAINSVPPIPPSSMGAPPAS